MPPRIPASTDTQPCRLASLVLVAAAASLGVGMGPTATAQGGTGGGAVYVEQPTISKAVCLRRCASRRRLQQGSTLRVTGDGLSRVRSLTFHGGPGRRDDLRTRVRSGSDSRLNVPVPMGAISGPISVSGSGGLHSRQTRSVTVLPAPPPEPNTTLTPVPGPRERGAPRLESGTSRTKVYLGSKRAVTFSYRISNGDAQSVAVELVRASDGGVVRRWAPAARAGTVQNVVWNGKAGSLPAPPGRYSFRLTVAGVQGRTARSAQVDDFSRDSFDLYDHVFPIRGSHNYGGPAARFGAGRSGHSHQGHDVFARCGTRLVAARGGQVQYSGYHSAAGNYVVIDGADTGIDYAYMHLMQPSPFRTGDRVYTGQQIGAVGQTGRASGCHLHFEMWSAPGWYTGGRAFDPLLSLRAWDAWS